MYCRNCGVEIRARAKYCRNCGEQVDIRFKAEKKSKKKRDNTINTLRVFVSVAVSLILVSSLSITLGTVHKERKIEDEIKKEFSTILGYKNNSNPIIDAIKDGFEVEVIKVSKGENSSYDVACIISNFDVQTAAHEIDNLEKDISFKDYYKKLSEEIVKTEKISIETVFSVKKSKGYSVFFTQEQLNYASGGILALYEKLFNEGGL